MIPALGAAIDRVAAEFDKRVVGPLGRVRCAIIHNDLNDHNILIGGGVDLESRAQSVTGIVDFGDMVYSYRVGELAIAIAYAILDRDDPLGVAAAIVRGYCERNSLDDHELASLFGLVLMRLCASACIAAEQQRRRPENTYLGVSQQAIRRDLPKLAAIPFGLAQTMLRAAAGVVPSPKAAVVRDYLKKVDTFAPVMGVDLEREACLVLDLSAEGPLVSGDPRENEEPALSERVFGAMKNAAVRIGVGRYNEPRLLYVAPGFSGGARPTDPHRTIHIGPRSLCAAGNAGVCAARRNRARVRGHRTAARLRPGHHPAPRDRRRCRVLHAVWPPESRVSGWNQSRPGRESRRSVRVARRCDGEWGMVAAPASTGHHGSPGSRHRLSGRRVRLTARRVGGALPRSQSHHANSDGSFSGGLAVAGGDAGESSCANWWKPAHRVPRSSEDRARVEAISLRRHGALFHRRVQQRAARGPLSSARRRRGRRANARAQHEHTLLERPARDVRRAALGDDACATRGVLLRQLGE
jgi:hypothetical protein